MSLHPRPPFHQHSPWPLSEFAFKECSFSPVDKPQTFFTDRQPRGRQVQPKVIIVAPPGIGMPLPAPPFLPPSSLLFPTPSSSPLGEASVCCLESCGDLELRAQEASWRPPPNCVAQITAGAENKLFSLLEYLTQFRLVRRLNRGYPKSFLSLCEAGEAVLSLHCRRAHTPFQLCLSR